MWLGANICIKKQRNYNLQIFSYIRKKKGNFYNKLNIFQVIADLRFVWCIFVWIYSILSFIPKLEHLKYTFIASNIPVFSTRSITLVCTHSIFKFRLFKSGLIKLIRMILYFVPDRTYHYFSFNTEYLSVKRSQDILNHFLSQPDSAELPEWNLSQAISISINDCVQFENIGGRLTVINFFFACSKIFKYLFQLNFVFDP